MNDLSQRKNIRLKGYDYSQPGYYFVTICTHNKQNLLGSVVGGGLCAAPSVRLSAIGKEIEKNLLKLPAIFAGIIIEPYVIMPNHIHFIVVLTGRNGDQDRCKDPGRRGDLPLHRVVGQFKSYTTKVFNDLNGTKNLILWQRNYYEHVIRNKDEYQKIYEYIHSNAAKWQDDKYFMS